MDVLLGEEEARANQERLELREIVQLYTTIQNNQGGLLIYYHLNIYNDYFYRNTVLQLRPITELFLCHF